MKLQALTKNYQIIKHIPQDLFTLNSLFNVDIGSSGFSYTWYNKRQMTDAIFGRLVELVQIIGREKLTQ